MSGMIQASSPRTLPKGLPQVAALLLVFLVNWLVFRDFFALRLQDGRLFGSLIDVLNRGAPVAILALGMTLVIATRGIDLSVGAVMAIAGAMAATLTAQGYPLPVALAAAAGHTRLWVVVAHALPGEEEALATALTRRGAWLVARLTAPGATALLLEVGD